MTRQPTKTIMNTNAIKETNSDMIMQPAITADLGWGYGSGSGLGYGSGSGLGMQLGLGLD